MFFLSGKTFACLFLLMMCSVLHVSLVCDAVQKRKQQSWMLELCVVPNRDTHTDYLHNCVYVCARVCPCVEKCSLTVDIPLCFHLIRRDQRWASNFFSSIGWRRELLQCGPNKHGQLLRSVQFHKRNRSKSLSSPQQKGKIYPTPHTTLCCRG